MPTTPARARKWIESGKAIKRWSDSGQFYVQLVADPSGRELQPIVIGIDPGKSYTGIGVQSPKFTLYTAHLVLPFKTVRERMDNRRLMRRGRRGRRINRKVAFSKRAHRQARFSNRRSSKLAPSIKANRDLEIKVASDANTAGQLLNTDSEKVIWLIPPKELATCLGGLTNKYL